MNNFHNDMSNWITEITTSKSKNYFTPNYYRLCPNGHGYVKLQSEGKLKENAKFIYSCDYCNWEIDVTEGFN